MMISRRSQCHIRHATLKTRGDNSDDSCRRQAPISHSLHGRARLVQKSTPRASSFFFLFFFGGVGGGEGVEGCTG